MTHDEVNGHDLAGEEIVALPEPEEDDEDSDGR